MTTILTKLGLGTVLAATALTGMAPAADAQRYRGYDRGYDRGYRDRSGDVAGAAVVAGIAGLVIGSALSSRDRGYRDNYYRQRGYSYNYDDSYYRQRGYYPNDGYYAYRNRGGYNRCRIEKRYDPYYGERVRVRVCY